MHSKLPPFFTTEASAGIILIAATAIALAFANSPLSETYLTILNAPLLGHTLTYWLNDALMALFFLLVGLEIKRELVQGQLATWPQRLLPGLAALGGMVVPAGIYVLVTRHHPSLHPGWAIPTATDIAFALGLLALIPRVPISLKIFLTALAIIDDLGAILLIAIFYTANIALLPLACAVLTFGGLVLLNKLKTTSLTPYLITGAVLWFFTYHSGLHPTLSGVLLALTIPIGSTRSPLKTLEDNLHPYVTYLILPLFAFFNAGVSLVGVNLQSLLHPATMGIMAGLFFGKQVGIGVAMWVACKLFKAPRPAGATVAQLYAVTLLCGIGFTMSLFIGHLALPASLAPQIRLGILTASTLSAILALLILGLSSRKHK